MQRPKRHPSRNQERDYNDGKGAFRLDVDSEAGKFELRLRLRDSHRPPVPMTPARREELAAQISHGLPRRNSKNRPRRQLR